MNAVTIACYAAEILAGLSALGILITRNVFHAALLLIICLLAIAALYVVTQAELLAVAQILLYAGGVLILIVFGIMLTSRLEGKPLTTRHHYVGIGVLTGILVMTSLTQLWMTYPMPAVPLPCEQNTVAAFGILFMTTYMLPFETVGILLLIALVGAAYTASSYTTNPRPS